MNRLTDIDCKKISEQFPELNCELKKHRIWGTLKFTCCYNAEKSELIHNATEGVFLISDSYEIEIDLRKFEDGCPKVYERSGIILAFAASNNIENEELHMYKDGSCCLGIYPEDKNLSVYEIILKRVVPFFYWQSYYRRHKKEPWKAYAHSKMGYQEKVEELDEQIIKMEQIQSHFPKAKSGSLRNTLCPCGSGKKYKKCCMDADLKARRKLYDLKETKNDVMRLYQKRYNEPFIKMDK